MPDTLIDKVKKTISQYNMLETNDRVLVSISGGPDSVFLLHCLIEIRKEYNLSLFAFHLDHMTRGGQSKQDAIFVKNLCKDKGIKLIAKEIDAMKWSKERNLSFQQGARKLRLKILQELSEKQKIQKIAIGHNADDNIETVLMNMIRGTGTRGLAGIDPKSGIIIRPIINIFRENIENFLNENNISYRIDITNKGIKYFRNKIRNILIPVIERELKGSFKKNFIETINIVRNENDYLEKLSGDLIKNNSEIVKYNKKTIFIKIPINFLDKFPIALKNRLILKAIELIKENLVDIKSENVKEIIEISKKDGESKNTRPFKNIIAVKEKNNLYIIDILFNDKLPEKYRTIIGHVDNVEENLKVLKSGETFYAKLNLRIYTQIIEGNLKTDFKKANKNEAFLDYDKINFPVKIRNWKKGDKFFPLGVGGEKKIQDFFTDLKIPKHSRELVPIFKDKEKIIWVAGYRIDQRVKITKYTSKILYLKIIRDYDEI